MSLLSPVAAALLIIGLLLWVRQTILRRGWAQVWKGGRADSKSIERVESMPLSASHSAHFIRCQDQSFLLVVYPGGCTVLDRFSSCRESPHTEERRQPCDLSVC